MINSCQELAQAINTWLIEHDSSIRAVDLDTSSVGFKLESEPFLQYANLIFTESFFEQLEHFVAQLLEKPHTLLWTSTKQNFFLLGESDKSFWESDK